MSVRIQNILFDRIEADSHGCWCLYYDVGSHRRYLQIIDDNGNAIDKESRKPGGVARKEVVRLAEGIVQRTLTEQERESLCNIRVNW